MSELTNKPNGATHYDGNFWRYNGSNWETWSRGSWMDDEYPDGDVRMISDMEPAAPTIGSANKQYTYDELKALVIAVTTEMDRVRPGMFHPCFTELCIMIAAHESLMGEHRVQIGGGPARGLLQIEELTYASVWQHSDTIAETAMRMGMQCDFSQIEQGDRHSIYICRHRIAMDSEPLPCNAFEMAAYAKRIWNGPGKATADDYYNAYMRVKNA